MARRVNPRRQTKPTRTGCRLPKQTGWTLHTADRQAVLQVLALLWWKTAVLVVEIFDDNRCENQLELKPDSVIAFQLRCEFDAIV